MSDELDQKQKFYQNILDLVHQGKPELKDSLGLDDIFIEVSRVGYTVMDDGCYQTVEGEDPVLVEDLGTIADRIAQDYAIPPEPVSDDNESKVELPIDYEGLDSPSESSVDSSPSDASQPDVTQPAPLDEVNLDPASSPNDIPEDATFPGGLDEVLSPDANDFEEPTPAAIGGDDVPPSAPTTPSGPYSPSGPRYESGNSWPWVAGVLGVSLLVSGIGNVAQYKDSQKEPQVKVGNETIPVASLRTRYIQSTNRLSKANSDINTLKSSLGKEQEKSKGLQDAINGTYHARLVKAKPSEINGLFNQFLALAGTRVEFQDGSAKTGVIAYTNNCDTGLEQAYGLMSGAAGVADFQTQAKFVRELQDRCVGLDSTKNAILFYNEN